MFILAFTSYPGIIWVGPCIGGIIFGFSVSIRILANVRYIRRLIRGVRGRWSLSTSLATHTSSTVIPTTLLLPSVLRT